MKTIQGKTEKNLKKYYPVTRTFEIKFENGIFEIDQVSSQKDNFWNGIEQGSFFAADERGSEVGKIRILTDEAFEIIQNSGYITGNTYEIKEIVKGLGFKWNREERRWEK